MRRMATATALAAAQLLCGLGCGGPPSTEVVDAKAGFALRAEALEMLEDGPFVIKVTLANRGLRPVKIYWDPWLPQAYYVPPSSWKPQKRHKYPTCDGIAWYAVELRPGEQRSEIIRVHEGYAKIPAGKSVVRVTWPVYAAPEVKIVGGDHPDLKLLAEPSVVLNVDVPAATSERLAALRKRLEEQLFRSDLADNEKFALVSMILDTRHHALAPIVWRWIEEQRWTGNNCILMEFVAECPEIYPDLGARLARLAADPSRGGRDGVFVYWGWNGADLSPAAWKVLTEADDVWTRALTYAFFRSRCDRAWKEALLRDLRDQSKPLPDSHFNGLLADLDSDDFDTREKASAQLARFGERAESKLRRSLDGTLSVEARQRVAAALERIAKAKQPPDCVQALGYFAAHDAPEDGELLRVLSEGAPDAWLTQQAKDKLAEWRKARGNTEK